MEKEIIPCVCCTCGVRNDFSNPSGYCQNGHDDWLEYRDFGHAETGQVVLAMKRTGLSHTTLYTHFIDTSIKQFKIVSKPRNSQLRKNHFIKARSNHSKPFGKR